MSVTQDAPSLAPPGAPEVRRRRCDPAASRDVVVGPAGPPGGPPRPHRRSPLQTVAVALAGALPVLWTMGALPWRSPTLLVENMFSGFARCAVADGALNPIVMVCRRAGTPIGMYQLDGGLSYPLGGVLLRLGLEPVAAWKVSVAVLILPGIAALFLVLRRMTGSAVLAAAFVVLYGLNGTLAARSWNWYWNVCAAAMLPVAFAALHVVFDRARARRLRTLLPPGGAVLAAVLAIALEWQYMGMFSTVVAAAAVCLLAAARGWRGRQRLLLLLGGAVGVAAVFALLRLRLTLAGITAQFADTVLTAGRNSIDLAAFVAPDGSGSLLGRLLAQLGRDDLVVGALAGGRQLWVTPYLGVLTIGVLLVAAATHRRRRQAAPGLPPGFVALLVVVTVASVVLSTGPDLRLAGLAEPTAVTASPLRFLYVSTPLRWIRYPWTWGYVTHVGGTLTCAALATLFLRRGRSWSPLTALLVVVLAVEFVSPQVLDTFGSGRPSVASATPWTRVARDDAAVQRFEATAIPELQRVLRGIDGTVLLLPWDNTYITPHLGPAVGAHVRNVGIDRNLSLVEAAAPWEARELRRPTAGTVQEILASSWAAAVVLLDHIPSGESILRFDDARLSRGERVESTLSEDERAWLQRVTRLETKLARAGYCVQRRSWFTIIERCARRHDVPGRPVR